MTRVDRLRRLLAAVPHAWAADPVFRYAAAGAAVSLVVLLAELAHGPSPSVPPLPPPAGVASPGPAPLGGPSPTPAAAPIAPERALNGVTIATDPKTQPDRFGTLSAARRRKETP